MLVFMLHMVILYVCFCSWYTHTCACVHAGRVLAHVLVFMLHTYACVHVTHVGVLVFMLDVCLRMCLCSCYTRTCACVHAKRPRQRLLEARSQIRASTLHLLLLSTPTF